MSLWTDEEVEKLLIQLNHYDLPFPNYRFVEKDHHLNLIGRGSTARVYQAVGRKKILNKSNKYAIKVMGFEGQHLNSEAFKELTQMQKEFGFLKTNVIQIYNTADLFVYIDDFNNVIKIEKSSAKNKNLTNCLHLHFMLMEELIPVLSRNEYGKVIINPEPLKKFDQNEMMKLAYDIAEALYEFHKIKMIHRDVKLENIFYSEIDHHYKLGDFGIAKKTSFGIASTKAFTRGYGAPEVISLKEEDYDYTADIYSFGMCLYLLFNKLCFPGSKNYRFNQSQYEEGYVVPMPILANDDLARIILKMISYDPEKRYQNMDEVLNALDELTYGKKTLNRRMEKYLNLALGMILSVIATVMLCLAYPFSIEIRHPFFTGLFLVLSFYKFYLYLIGKKMNYTALLFILSVIYLILADGFHLWKTVLLLYLVFMGDVTTALFALCFVTYQITKFSIPYLELSLPVYYHLKWMMFLLFSLSISLILNFIVLNRKEHLETKEFIHQNLIPRGSFAFYFSLLTIYFFLQFGIKLQIFSLGPYIEKLTSSDILFFSLGGLGFWAIWYFREIFLIRYLSLNKHERL